MERALYGPAGFYRRTSEGPADHFRTSANATPLFATAISRLAADTGLRTVVDVGAGRGELLRGLHEQDAGLRLLGVEVAARPAGLPAEIGWTHSLPDRLDALVLANEWLDNVPVDVVTVTGEGRRVLLVDTDGAETLGPALEPADAAWLDRWWPLSEPGERAEIGRTRDEAWAGVVRSLHRGVAVAVDYAHEAADRPPDGTLTGYRHGRQVPPVPDGSCDVTAHVALDACAAAGEAAGATATLRLSQREALGRLGLRGERPDRALASIDPPGYLRALRDAGEVAEVTARGGLGDFGWLVQTVGLPLPPMLARATGAATGG